MGALHDKRLRRILQCNTKMRGEAARAAIKVPRTIIKEKKIPTRKMTEPKYASGQPLRAGVKLPFLTHIKLVSQQEFESENFSYVPVYL